MLRHFSIALLAFFLALNFNSAASAAGDAEKRAAKAYEAALKSPPQLRLFLSQMPKGGDLHNHLDGAVYAENFIRWAIEDGLCVQREPPGFAAPPCDESKAIVSATRLNTDYALRDALINSLSMRDFVPGKEAGYAHFFNTFPRFIGAFPERRQGDMIAEVVARLENQNTFYVELMISPNMFVAAGLGSTLEWNDDIGVMAQTVDSPKIQNLVEATKQFFDRAEHRKNEILKCNTAQPDAGCRVHIRYLAQVIRTFPKSQVLTQIAFGAALAKADPRVVGLNLVAPEHSPITLRDYTDQMRMVGYFTNKGRDVRVTLHAGELALGLVPPEDLRFHIREAIEVAGARRIGHGVAISYEDKADDLLRHMSKDRIPVEINLTSNDVILGVKNEHHPFLLYRKHGVPLTLSTDDEGVSRSDLTNEYRRAALAYKLSYHDLKHLARNALHYSFLPGASLWAKSDNGIMNVCTREDQKREASTRCQNFLNESEKARLQWELEKDFIEFESRF